MKTTTTTGTSWAHDLVAMQAKERPTSLAVQDHNQKLTFAELDLASTRIAHYLKSLGVHSEVPVGLYFERSVDFVVAALAVLKAGGAYVPVETNDPPERIGRIFEDVGISVLLSHRWMAASLSPGPWVTVDLDIDRETLARQSVEPLTDDLDGSQLAYIVYTSGSTGQPKGVEITHANLQHLINWHHRAFSVTDRDRASQIAGLAFDAAVWEIWCNLTAGATLHIVDELSRRSAEGLQGWLVGNRITVCFAPTLLAEQLMVLAWPNRIPLRLLLTGADTLHRFPRAGLPFTLVNNYGPTECTVLVTSGLVLNKHVKGELPPIGRPISGMEVLVLNESLRPVPNGDEGEICIAGPQIGRGYRNLPKLTAERFTREPVGGRRIYRTADRGKVLPDGQIAFLGRLDDQVKVRGFRIEPDEVIAHLNLHPDISNSTVVVHGNAAEEKALVAYVVTAKGRMVGASELRKFLQARLPAYMIPSVFVTLPSLPVTFTGKCDKGALPIPNPENLLPEEKETDASIPHSNTTESRVTQLIRGLVDKRDIQRDDNFFIAGGHSMLAAQLLARIRESFQVSLSLRQLFESPTIASLSSFIETKLPPQ